MQLSRAFFLSTASTIHQHFAQQNPFFSVALYHEIGAEEGGGFRVRASAPCRVEVYDAESLALLAVDADGDGSFRGVGDLLAAGELRVSVLKSADRWFGMTYHEDRARVARELIKLHETGAYPEELR